MKIHSFLGLFPHFSVDVLEDMKKAEFLICFGARNLNEKQRSIISIQKNFPNEFKSVAMLSSQNVDWKMMAIISVKMRHPGFEIFFESSFRIAIIA